MEKLLILFQQILTLDSYYETNHNFIEYIKKEELGSLIAASKETEEDYENSQDALLDNSKDEIINKSTKLNELEVYERFWVLSAKVLKNSEEIEDKDLKLRAIKSTINCSMLFMTIYKTLLQIFEDKILKYTDEEFKEQFIVINKLLPVFQQIILTQTLGTGKLNIAIEIILKEILTKKNISDLEKFMYVFLYADLKGENYFKYIEELIKSYKTWYMKDMIFAKLFEYYIRKDTNRDEELILKNFMGDLLDDTDNNRKRNFTKKGNIISKIEQIKLENTIKNQ